MAYRAKDFLDAIPGSGGTIAGIAKRVGCDWHTAKKAIENFPTVARAFEAERETLGDKAESNIAVVIAQAKDSDRRLATSKWYLSRVRSDRFSTRKKIDAEVSVVEGLSTEERYEKLRELLSGKR